MSDYLGDICSSYIFNGLPINITAWSLLRVCWFYLCRCRQEAGSVADLFHPAESTLPVWNQSGEPMGCGA